jgi:hypothetical protein
MKNLLGFLLLLFPQFASAQKNEGLVYKVETFSGATADVKLKACIAQISSGGVCDARGFGPGSQTITSTITMGGSTGPETILFDPSTKFVPSSASTQMFNLGPALHINGLHVDTSSVTSYAAFVLVVNSNVRDYPHNLVLTDTEVDGSNSHTAGSGCLQVSGSNTKTQSVAFIKVEGFRCYGMQYGLYLTASGSGWVNGNMFSNVVCDYDQYCIVLNGTSTTSGSAVASNTFVNVQSQAGGTTTPLLIEGVSQNNIIHGFISWDNSSADVSITGRSAVGNYIDCSCYNSISDSSGNSNVVFNNTLSQSTFQAHSFMLLQPSFSGLQFAQGRGLLGNSRRGISLQNDPQGDLTFWINSTETNPGFYFKDGNGGATLGEILPGGLFQIGTGTNIVYRCTVAGTLPVGALTINRADCERGIADTGLRVK